MALAFVNKEHRNKNQGSKHFLFSLAGREGRAVVCPTDSLAADSGLFARNLLNTSDAVVGEKSFYCRGPY